MYSKIIVPLDGSELAECVIPHVEAIAKGCGVKEVVLIRAVEPTNLQGAYFSEDELKRIDADNLKAAQDYVAKLAKKVKFGKATVNPFTVGISLVYQDLGKFFVLVFLVFEYFS